MRRLALLALCASLFGCTAAEEKPAVNPDAVSQSKSDRVDNWWLRTSPKPQDQTLEILVHEQDCASGQSAEGLIASDVQYEGEAIVVRVNVRPRTEDRSCPGNPDTPYEIELREPLGDRSVLDGNSSPPAPARTERPRP